MLSSANRFVSVGSNMTLKQAKAAFACGDIVLVDKHPNQLSIQFITRTSDLYFVVTASGKIRRFKDRMDLDLAICSIKGL